MPDINPQLKDLAPLIGDWEMMLSNASFLDTRDSVLHGTARFEWFDDGDLVVLKQNKKGSGEPWATWMIGHDQDAAKYTLLYIDDRRCSRVYEMTLEGKQWKLWRQAPEFTQRFTGTINDDNTEISGAWEKSKDGETWEHDFDLKYTKR